MKSIRYLHPGPLGNPGAPADRESWWQTIGGCVAAAVLLALFLWVC